MWWTLAASVALALNLALGVFLLWSGRSTRDTTTRVSPPCRRASARAIADVLPRWEASTVQTDCPVRVRLTNVRTDATVDGVRFDVWCFDNFGDVLHAPAHRDHPGFGMP